MDPVSAVGAAGSAVALASTALWICKALVDFYSSLKSAEEDITAMIQSSTELITCLVLSNKVAVSTSDVRRVYLCMIGFLSRLGNR
jgi:hypothetical protein